ncbi:GRB10-interacting GYF protein 2-like isoform X2 [Rhopilema esculentum]|uniref:GRB10-interacting GYF protein 2-like isoform X2 n=1 Tax=Rhopilema esculentum TaxID=499914 RepID=UPI0031D73601
MIMSEFKMTFGPEWLRALAGGDTNTETQSKSVAVKRFKLADFRYGREEMLALFSEAVKMPKSLQDFGDVIVQETQCQPLSFIPMTEEEERCQVAGVNSQVVLRMTGRGAPIRGRGAIRGSRGRGRGEGQPGTYRTLSNDESGYSNQRDQYTRRPWTEGARGGSTERISGRGEPPGVRGGLEPRPRLPSDRGGATTEREPWRSISQEEDDGGGWRISGQRSWRKGSADASRNWRSDKSKDEDNENSQRRSWNRASSTSGLPEWCDDDVEQDVGTFDSSGQFKSLRSADDPASKTGKDDTTEPVFEDYDAGSNKVEATGKRKNDFGGTINYMDSGVKSEKEGATANKASRESSSELESQASYNLNTSSSVSLETEQRTEKRLKELLSSNPVKSPTKSITPGHISVSELEKEFSSVNTKESNSRINENARKVDDLTIDDVRSVQHDMRKILAESHSKAFPRANDHDENVPNIEDDIKNLIDKLDDEIDNINPTNQMAPQQPDTNDCNVLDPSIIFAKKAEPGGLIKGMQAWIYRDPQGEIQGPFSCEEMLEWFKAGYFTMELLVRRVCDEIFLPLGDIIKLWNRVPFQPGPEPPSITSQVYAAQLARRQQGDHLTRRQQGDHLARRQQEEYQRITSQQRKVQQQRQQIEQHELRILQQMKEQQQFNEMQQRPHNLNFPEDVSIWGESPTPSPNLASTPWTPTSSHPDPVMWNNANLPNAKLEHHRSSEKIGAKSEPDIAQSTSEAREDAGIKAWKTNGTAGSTSPADSDIKQGEEYDAAVEDRTKVGQGSKKVKEKKKKQDGEKKKEDRDKQQRQDEEAQRTQEILEKQQQEFLAAQRKKEDEEREHQMNVEMQQRQLKQQQHMLHQMKQRQLLVQQQQKQNRQERIQQEQRRQNMNEAHTWNIPSTSSAPSLAEIQRLEEERQMLIHEKMKQIQAHEQQLQQQQQRAAAGWTEKGGPPVMSLRQIQEEESRKLLAMSRNQHHQPLNTQQPRMSHGLPNASVWTKSASSPANFGAYDNLFWDDVMTRSSSMQESSQFSKGSSKPRVVSDSAFPTLNVTSKQNKKSKDEEVVHRLFQQTNPCDDFVHWVNKNMPGIARYVDVPTFVSFLQEIESPYEVNEYIRSYFGEFGNAEKFAKEFLEWNRRNRKQRSPQSTTPTTNSEAAVSSGYDVISPEGDDPNGRRKKHKKRMQKVSPNLLGFSCNANPDMVNRGEIQSAMDAWSTK